MEYELFLKYKAELQLNINDKYSGALCDQFFADIIYEPDDAVDDAEDDDREDTKIGFVKWVHYNQALAMAYNVNMTEIPFLTLLSNSR